MEEEAGVSRLGQGGAAVDFLEDESHDSQKVPVSEGGGGCHMQPYRESDVSLPGNQPLNFVADYPKTC